MTNHPNTITCQGAVQPKFSHTLRKNTGMELPAKNVTNPLSLEIPYTLPSPKETANTIMKSVGIQCFIDMMTLLVKNYSFQYLSCVKKITTAITWQVTPNLI